MAAGSADTARAKAVEAGEVARARQDLPGLAEALELEAASTGDEARARSLLEQSRRVWEEVAAPVGVARVDLALSELGDGDPALAEGVLLGKLRPLLLGEDPFNVERIWQRVFDGAAMYNPKGAVVAGLSGVDLACWDIIGKALGQPVCKLIGGLCREAIPAYASDLHWQDDPAAMASRRSLAPATTAAANSSESFTVSNESKSGGLSSCRSRL